MVPEHFAKINLIAKTCHEVNKIYCESIGDHSQPSWENAPDWQKKSAINGVIFHLLNPYATPEDSHKNWLEEKKAAGWVYGSIKNPEIKAHPCIVDYKDLPKEQRDKDKLYMGAIGMFKNLDVKED